jgi:hypothetical protein
VLPHRRSAWRIKGWGKARTKALISHPSIPHCVARASRDTRPPERRRARHRPAACRHLPSGRRPADRFTPARGPAYRTHLGSQLRQRSGPRAIAWPAYVQPPPWPDRDCPCDTWATARRAQGPRPASISDRQFGSRIAPTSPSPMVRRTVREDRRSDGEKTLSHIVLADGSPHGFPKGRCPDESDKRFEGW